MYSFLGIARPQSQFPHSCVCVFVSNLYIPRIGPHISLQQNRQTDPKKYINLSQIYECRNWETEHYNSVLEVTVPFRGIHKMGTRHLYRIFTSPFLQSGVYMFVYLLCFCPIYLPSPCLSVCWHWPALYPACLYCPHAFLPACQLQPAFSLAACLSVYMLAAYPISICPKPVRHI